MKLIRKMLFVSLAALAMTTGPAAMAQEAKWPSRAMNMIVPFPPGGPTDLIARVLAKHLGDQLGQPIVVENKAGANATIGMAAAAKANADGYTLLYNTSSIALAPALYKQLSFDPLKDFDAVSSTAVIPMVLLTHPSVPASTVQEFVAYARKHPQQLSYGSAGAGNITHLGAFLFNQTTGIDATHIPYRGSAPALTDLVGGQVQFMANTLNDSLPFIKEKRVKALAITSIARNPAVPDVPTIAETVIPGFEMGAWQGIMVPAGTPTAIVTRLNSEIRKALQTDTVRAQLKLQGAEPLGATPQEYQQYIVAETKRLGDVIASAGVKLN
ncbi:Bug family tripartite tricarboxylate transporter substrate binding protein [Paracandidimonas lactea]|uniref:Bug family tripartite tricarboxylate transporter substrate binding protein n=1 Tax=Paracandidimonas lactea TaxID=2895524 RepID=UPI001F2D3019|nr:tripartite tricarboxylate transporter substrate binding protein [Paracandidimonas lactea]